MVNNNVNQVFLSYGEKNRDFVESLALRLRSDARLSFWFAPWHSIPGVAIQEQMEHALQKTKACAVFLTSELIEGWQNEQMRIAIQRRIDEDSTYRVIPVLLPGILSSKKLELPAFLRRYEMIQFDSYDDDLAFKRLISGILGIPPFQLEDYIQVQSNSNEPSNLANEKFAHGHGLVIGIAHYANINNLPNAVLNDARELRLLLENSAGYTASNIISLLDDNATRTAIRAAFDELALRTDVDDTVIIFYSGHGAHNSSDTKSQYILPYDCTFNDLEHTCISGEELTTLISNIRANRVLVILDSCHSGGIGNPKDLKLNSYIKYGLSEDYYAVLAQGKGRAIIASSRSDEVSWVLEGMQNSLMTHYLLAALRGKCKTLGDGYVRVFDVFRHIAENVSKKANQHPIFKANAMEDDFVVARLIL